MYFLLQVPVRHFESGDVPGDEVATGQKDRGFSDEAWSHYLASVTPGISAPSHATYSDSICCDFKESFEKKVVCKCCQEEKDTKQAKGPSENDNL